MIQGVVKQEMLHCIQTVKWTRMLPDFISSIVSTISLPLIVVVVMVEMD